MMEAQGMSQGQDASVSSPQVNSQQAPVQTTAPQEEKVFKQSEVNALIGRKKAEAIEEYRRQQAEQPNYVNQKYGEPAHTQNPAQMPHNLPSEQEVRRLAAEEAQRLRDEWMQEARTRTEQEQAQKTVQNFFNKISPGKEKYQDFDAVTGDIEYARFPNVVQLLADHVDNSHDMLYELGKDRTKMALLEQLAYMSPQDAIKQAKRMSQSLKDNDAASKVKIPNEPLSQMRPSNTGTDNGVMGVGDYRKRWKV